MNALRSRIRAWLGLDHMTQRIANCEKSGLFDVAYVSDEMDKLRARIKALEESNGSR